MESELDDESESLSESLELDEEDELEELLEESLSLLLDEDELELDCFLTRFLLGRITSFDLQVRIELKSPFKRIRVTHCFSAFV